MGRRGSPLDQSLTRPQRLIGWDKFHRLSEWNWGTLPGVPLIPVPPDGWRWVIVVDEGRARELAQRFLKETIRPKVAHDLVLTTVDQYENCWVVTYNTRRFAETGEIRYALAGNGPLIVNRRTGVVRQGLASRPVEDQLDAD
jgi:hypothetical protein